MSEKYIGVRVLDTESKYDTGSNDRYSLVIRPDGDASVSRTFEKADKGPNGNINAYETLAMNDVPSRVADVFDVYVDASALRMSPAGNNQSLEHESATITIKENSVEYKFAVYDRKHVEVIVNAEGELEGTVPASIVNEAKNHIPKDAMYLSGGSVHS